MDPLKVCSAWRGQSNCLACDGQENAFFSGLSSDAIRCLHIDVNNSATPAASILYHRDAVAEYAWVLRTGVVKLLASSWDGSQRIVRVLKAGDVAGLEALLAGTYAHEAVTVGEVRACRIPLEAIRALCLEHPAFQWNLMIKMQSALRETEQWLVDLASTGVSARVRMARLLLRLRVGEGNRIYSFSREELGLMLGVTIETASRIIASFLREKILSKGKSGSRLYHGNIKELELVAQGN